MTTAMATPRALEIGSIIATHNGVNIMSGIPQPPAIEIPYFTQSAPESRMPDTPPAAPRSKSTAPWSNPVSPKDRNSPRNRSPIGKKKFILKPIIAANSPTRAIKRHTYHVSFARFNPRSIAREPACKSNAYVSAEQEIKHLPNSVPAHGVPFGATPRDTLTSTRPTCPVHVYAEAKSMLENARGGATFSKFPKDFAKEVDPACPIHAYEATTTSLKMRPSTFAKFVSPRHTAEASGPAVHAYSTPKSTLKTSGAAAFSMEKRDGKSTMRSLAPVHSYGGLTSTLSKGGASFGTSARSSLPTLTRTGLVTAAVTPSAARSVPTSLPPLVPKVSVVEAIKEEGGEDAFDSPREIEAVLA